MTLYEIIRPVVRAYEMGLSVETDVLVKAVNELTAKLPGVAIAQLDAYQDGMHDAGLCRELSRTMEAQGEQRN